MRLQMAFGAKNPFSNSPDLRYLRPIMGSFFRFYLQTGAEGRRKAAIQDLTHATGGDCGNPLSKRFVRGEISFEIL
jgi:hypothetical protein